MDENQHGIESDSDLEAELDRIFAARDRAYMAPTIAALVPIREQHPRNPRVLYELGGAYDTAGEEAKALPPYEQAMAEGLEGDVLRRCYLQYGSTLRNLDRIDDSLAAFARARRKFPDSVSLGVHGRNTPIHRGWTRSAGPPPGGGSAVATRGIGAVSPVIGMLLAVIPRAACWNSRGRCVGRRRDRVTKLVNDAC